MKMDNLVRNLRVLWRADSILADIKLRQVLFRSGVNAFAALIAVFGLLMMEFAAYFALVQFWNAILAATTLGLGNFVIAMLLTLIASRRGHGRDANWPWKFISRRSKHCRQMWRGQRSNSARSYPRSGTRWMARWQG